MFSRRAMVTVCAALALTGCAKRPPGSAGVPPNTPHLSWIIMHGDRDNPDAEFACQSTGPRECLVPASRNDTQVFSDVHVYYFGAGPETRYVGSYRVGFFQRADENPRELSTNITVREGQKLVNQSVTGIVTGIPGTYAVRFAVDASMTGIATSQPILEEVAVTVR
jgi:hypothetical protein